MTVVTLGSISKESEFSRSIAIIFAEGKIEFPGDLGKVRARHTQVGHSEQSIVVSVERRVCQLELSSVGIVASLARNKNRQMLV